MELGFRGAMGANGLAAPGTLVSPTIPQSDIRSNPGNNRPMTASDISSSGSVGNCQADKLQPVIRKRRGGSRRACNECKQQKVSRHMSLLLCCCCSSYSCEMIEIWLNQLNLCSCGVILFKCLPQHVRVAEDWASTARSSLPSSGYQKEGKADTRKEDATVVHHGCTSDTSITIFFITDGTPKWREKLQIFDNG